MKKITLLILFYLLTNSIEAQQWIEKKYQYETTSNVPYGTAINFNGGIDSLKMDIYTPICDDLNHVSKRPLLIWIHGGAFLAGDKNETSITNLCKKFAERGYVTASINYRLGFISDNHEWSCLYPNYSCVFASDPAEWYRAYYRAVQDAKGALRFLINRNSDLRIDTNNVFIAGESAGAIVAFGVGLLDDLTEKPVQAYAIADAPSPHSSTFSCVYNLGKIFPNTTIPRPDLGDINGTIEPTTITYTIKGIGNMYGAMFNDLLENHVGSGSKPAIYSFHQPCDLVVPIDIGPIYKGLTWCMNNGYNCFGIANTPTIYGSRAFSNWNTNNGYGYNIHNEFTTTPFPTSFWFGAGSCADQVNNPCHAYDNPTLRENNLAAFFAPMINTFPICDTTLSNSSFENENSKFNIYPNPTTDIINIEVEQYQNATISVLNILGEIAIKAIPLQGNHTQIDLKNLSAGVYIVVLKDGKGMMHIERLLKE